MKPRLFAAVLVTTALLLCSAQPGLAAGRGGWSHGGHAVHSARSAWHGGHGGVRFGVFVVPGFWWGAPTWGPWWWGRPYPYYAAPPVVIEQAPPTYVQPQQPAAPPAYWYYCQNPQGYYPYIKECPGGWMTVVPPSSGPPGAPGP